MTVAAPGCNQDHPDLGRCAAGRRGMAWVTAISLSHWLMIPVLVMATILRTQEISTVGVSFDESFCQKMVEFTWHEIFDRIGLDTHPPLFYVMLKIWAQFFGNGVVAGRLLTALWGIASIAGIYAFLKTAYHRNEWSARQNFLEADLPAVVAAALLAMAPLHIFWTLQIRMYSLAVALTVWSSYFLVRALQGTGSEIGTWSAYTFTAILLAHSHTFGFFVLAAQYLYAIACRWHLGKGSLTDRLGPAAVSACCLSVSLQWWLPYLFEQKSRVNQSFYLPKPDLELLGTTMHELWVGMGVPYSPTTGLIIAQASLLVLLGLVMGRRPADYLIMLSAALPVAAAFIISAISQPIVTARYFMFSQVFLIAAVALVACRIPRFGRFVAILLLVVSASFPCRAQYQWRAGNAKLPGMRAAVAKLDADRGEHPLIVCNPMLYTSVLTYIHDRTRVYNFLPQQGFPFYQGTPVMRDEEYVDSEWLRTTKHDHIWTLDNDGSIGRVPVPRDWKLLGEERYQEWFANLTIRLYARSDAS